MIVHIRVIGLFWMVIVLSNIAAHAAVYTYPLLPESPEWKSLTPEERIESQQIPAQILQSMTTGELYESFMKLPSRIRMLEYPAIQEGFRSMRERFNVIAAFMEREDAGMISQHEFLAYDIDDTNNTDFEYQYLIDMTAIILSQWDILKEFTETERTHLATHALSILQINASLAHSSYWEIPNLVLIGRILQTEKYQPFKNMCDEHPELETMLDDGVLFGIPGQFEISDFMNMAEEFVTGE